jgi:hypothetical protein
MLWKCLPACLCALAACGAEVPRVPPEILLLAGIRAHMAATLDRQPDYTCIEEIERSHRLASRGQYHLLDMLRLEVALVGGKEMFAWPGARSFEYTDLLKMVPAGAAIGNGNFALHARNVFDSSSPTFLYSGREKIDGREAVRYDYRVLRRVSRYSLRMRETEAVVGYHGSFWVAPATLDAIRLTVIADDVPQELHIRVAENIMDYARLKIGTGEFLLPRASELFIEDTEGNENRNRIRFEGCREYTGESVLSFAPPPKESADKTLGTEPRRNEIELPAGEAFDARLETVIDSDRSMVGDPVRAVLAQNIKQKRHILFPKGSVLLGRILRLERRQDQCVLDLEFSDLDSATAHSSIAATLDAVAVPAPSFGYRSAFVDETPERRGLLFFHSHHLHLGRGLLFRLRTRERPPKAE